MRHRLDRDKSLSLGKLPDGVEETQRVYLVYGLYALSNLNKHFPSIAKTGEMQLLLREDMLNLQQNKC